MTTRIASASKLSVEQKSDKMKALKEANKELIDGFDSFNKIKVRAAMAKLGENDTPKPPVSQDE